jgi:hypothetical protein
MPPSLDPGGASPSPISPSFSESLVAAAGDLERALAEPPLGGGPCAPSLLARAAVLDRISRILRSVSDCGLMGNSIGLGGPEVPSEVPAPDAVQQKFIKKKFQYADLTYILENLCSFIQSRFIRHCMSIQSIRLPRLKLK